ncbi:hypothetical protein ACSRDC_18530, partial [Acinetobacter baumannii]
MVVPKLIFVHEVSYAIDDSGLAFSSSHSAVNFPPLLIASIWAYLVSPVYSVDLLRKSLLQVHPVYQCS